VHTTTQSVTLHADNECKAESMKSKSRLAVLSEEQEVQGKVKFILNPRPFLGKSNNKTLCLRCRIVDSPVVGTWKINHCPFLIPLKLYCGLLIHYFQQLHLTGSLRVYAVVDSSAKNLKQGRKHLTHEAKLMK
jgi:hypothetical protein